MATLTLVEAKRRKAVRKAVAAEVKARNEARKRLADGVPPLTLELLAARIANLETRVSRLQTSLSVQAAASLFASLVNASSPASHQKKEKK